VRASIEEEAAELDVNTLDFRSVGISSWKVKVKIGLIYDFNDFKTFNKNIRDGRVTATDLISFDGSEWLPIGNLDDLSKRFCEMFVRKKRAMEDDVDEVGEDEPTRIMQSSSEVNDKKSLLGPADEEPVGPAVSVSPANPEAPSEGLDSAAALADALADAAAEVDGARADESWKSGKTDSKQPPRFVDPFEKTAQQRSAGQRRSSSSAPSKADNDGGNRGMMIAAVLLIVLLGGGGYWFTNQQGGEAAPSPADEATATASPAADDESSDPNQIRADLLETLKSQAQPVVAEAEDASTDAWDVPQEQERIVIIPEEFRDGGDGVAPDQNGTMSVGGGEGAASHSSEGDTQARGANWSAAAAAYQKAVELEPRNMRYIERLCEYRYRSGNVTSARNSCSQSKNAGSREASKWLGHIAYDQGDTAGAVGHYQTYISSNPPDRSEIQGRIDSISGG
jgi:cytochrome c-type biogenesis protein CcmH/NrfG